jgi:Asp-tRNA(Asn)/Glu-tRNA(Gln) amidotransferase A subunit family amidase
LPAAELSSAGRKRNLSPTEIVDALLARIEKIKPKVLAYCTVAAEIDREAAKKAEAQVMRAGELGPLHGVPVSVKDLTLTTVKIKI